MSADKQKRTLQAAAAVLLLAGMALIGITEKSLAEYRAAAARHGGQVIDLGSSEHPDAGQSAGEMVRVVGPINVVEPPYDEQFNQRFDAPVLIRHVEMFQWREVHIGEQLHYEMDWVDRPVDASRFAQPSGHDNPGGFPIEGKQFDARQVRVNQLILSPPLLHALPGSERVAPDMKQLPSNLAASFSLYQNYLMTSATPANPRLGDLRVSWEIAPKQTVTVFARLDGERLAPASDAADGKGYDIQSGDRALTDIFPDLPLPPGGVWMRRVLALLLIVAGVLLWVRARRNP
ncbi:TMEM43 family protein [Dyella silvatica]|uniref:TMEM43 family protein n=1 Tax=Dyella silvatica TaxID=2992128 RepID=UPI00224DBBC0|nr:TMEM43 family protein [Dyella silvatica]